MIEGLREYESIGKSELECSRSIATWAQAPEYVKNANVRFYADSEKRASSARNVKRSKYFLAKRLRLQQKQAILQTLTVSQKSDLTKCWSTFNAEYAELAELSSNNFW